MPVRDPPFTVVTAADRTYERTLWQMLRSAERQRLPDAHRFIAFDLGMTITMRDRIGARFPWCRLDTFEFSRVPRHVARLVSCAWKPVAIARVLEERGGSVLWVDSATLFHGSLTPVIERIARDGVFTLAGQSALTRWCHPDTLREMRVPAEDLGKPCRFGGALGFDGERPLVREIVARWRACALRAECIDPPGASRVNHRYDQSVLTNLLCAFERERGLRLGSEEVDISSCSPVPWISTRNKVAAWVPVAADPIARGYHAVYKRLDRLVLRTRRRLAATPAGPPQSADGGAITTTRPFTSLAAIVSPRPDHRHGGHRWQRLRG